MSLALSKIQNTNGLRSKTLVPFNHCSESGTSPSVGKLATTTLAPHARQHYISKSDDTVYHFILLVNPIISVAGSIFGNRLKQWPTIFYFYFLSSIGESLYFNFIKSKHRKKITVAFGYCAAIINTLRITNCHPEIIWTEQLLNQAPLPFKLGGLYVIPKVILTKQLLNWVPLPFRHRGMYAILAGFKRNTPDLGSVAINTLNESFVNWALMAR